MNLTLTGTCFAFDVPATWAAETNDGMVTATSDESVAGVTPNAVLREWQVKRPARPSLGAGIVGEPPGNLPGENHPPRGSDSRQESQFGHQGAPPVVGVLRAGRCRE